ncbi:MAG TPA: lysophospholipid acyltransferase family protein [Dehalococcoidia bacterium]
MFGITKDRARLQSRAEGARVMARRARVTFNIFSSIYILGTVGGLLICLLEATRRIRFYGYSRLPLWEGKLILASNHPGWLDIVLVPLLYFPWWFGELLQRIGKVLVAPLKILKRESVRRTFTEDFKHIPASTADGHNFRHFRWVLGGWNIFVNRGSDGTGERASALRQAVEILENNGRVVIFPGGGRDFKARNNGDGIYDAGTGNLIIRRPRAGIGWIVNQTGASIVPIRIDGTDKVLPNRPNEKLPRFLRFERYLPRIWRPICIRIGEPLRFPAGTDEDTILQGYIQAQRNLYLEVNKSNGQRI